MNKIIKDFLATVNSLHQLKVENLPDNVLNEMVKMDAKELYKLCTQFIVLQHNIPTEDKMITMDEDELLTLVEDYAKGLLKRFKG